MTATLEPTNIPDAQSSSASHEVIGVGDTNSLTPRIETTATRDSVSAPNFPDAQTGPDSQITNGVGEPNLPQPISPAKAIGALAAALNLPHAQAADASQSAPGVGDQTTETAHGGDDSQTGTGGFGSDSEDGADAQKSADSHSPCGVGPILADPTLAMCADVVDDLEKVKIANQNRLRTLTMDGEHGHGLTLDQPDVQRLAALVKAVEDAEHQATLNLARVMRHHPLGEFVKNSKGIGEKQAARLLASIGDPYWNDLHNRPRTVRELYRFCGMDVVGTSAQGGLESQRCNGAGVAPTKQRGERVHWNPDARMRLWLIASKCVMVGHGGPYRTIYDQGRAKYADAVHAVECKRCGPKGKPAQPGSPLSAAHQHARAIRLIAKAILRDLWAEAKRIHETKGEQQ